jgi:hypothetical protein
VIRNQSLKEDDDQVPNSLGVPKPSGGDKHSGLGSSHDRVSQEAGKSLAPTYA